MSLLRHARTHACTHACPSLPSRAKLNWPGEPLSSSARKVSFWIDLSHKTRKKNIISHFTSPHIKASRINKLYWFNIVNCAWVFPAASLFAGKKRMSFLWFPACKAPDTSNRGVWRRFQGHPSPQVEAATHTDRDKCDQWHHQLGQSVIFMSEGGVTSSVEMGWAVNVTCYSSKLKIRLFSPSGNGSRWPIFVLVLHLLLMFFSS